MTERPEGPRQRPLRADDGGLWIVSPSQHEKLDPVEGCDQSWAFNYVENIKQPEKASATFGTDVHLNLDTYFKTLQLPNALTHVGDVAIRFLKRLPMPHASLLIEHEFSTEISTDPLIREQGKIDVYDPSRQCSFLIGNCADDTLPCWNAFDPSGCPRPLVIDHKTTGDFKWLKTDDVLRGIFDPVTSKCLLRPDPQPAIYGFKALQDCLKWLGRYPDEVHFRWNYALRSESHRQIKTVDMKMTAQEILRNVEVLKPEALHAIELAASSTPLHDFPKNYRACGKFGGCGYGPGTVKNPGLNICRVNSGDRMKSIMSGNNTPSSLAQQAASLFASTPAQPPPNGSPFSPQSQQQSAPSPFGQPPSAPSPFQQSASPFVQNSAPQQSASPFGQPQQQSASPFGGQPAQQTSPFAGSAPQQSASPFAQQSSAPAPQAQPMTNVFTQQASPHVQNPTTSMFAPQTQSSASPFAQSAAPAFQAQQPAVDPDLARVPVEYRNGREAAYLQWCRDNKLDVATGQPLQVATPSPSSPNSALVHGQIMPSGAIAQQQQTGGFLFYGRDETTGQNIMSTSWQQLKSPTVAAEAPKKKRGRKSNAQKELERQQAIASGQPVAPDDEDDESPQILITEKAVKEMITFLQSLLS